MLSTKEITRKWETIAQGKASLSIPNLLLLGILAGMFIAFGALGSTVVSSGVGGGLGKLLGACVFPTGLILVVMAGAELFTGNCLMAGPALNGKVKWTGVRQLPDGWPGAERKSEMDGRASELVLRVPWKHTGFRHHGASGHGQWISME